MKVHKPITPKIFDAWRAADFDLQEITDWTEEGVNLRHAIAWQDAGFYPNGGPYDEHDVCGWLKWDCTPEQAVKYLHQGCEEAPWDGFKKLGISLEDAVFLQLNGIDDEYLEKHMEVYEQITPKIFNAWRAADFGFDEIIDWTEEGVNLRDAIVWRDAGFYPEGGDAFDGEHDVCGWLAWDCTPEQAVKYLHQGCQDAPSERSKELGISLEDAVFFQLNSVEGDDADYLLDIFLPSGLSPKKIVKLKSQLDEASEEFEDMCLEDEDFKGGYSSSFYGSLPEMFESLKSVGLPINVANLKKYWQLSDKQILKVIDYGVESRVVYRIIRQGVPVNKIGIAAWLIELGMTYPSAASLVKRGLTLKHLKLLVKKDEPKKLLRELDDFLDSDSDIKIEECLLWLEVPQGIDWRNFGFTPQEAAKWSYELFSPKMARSWRDAGADSPLTAKRRREAGLNP